ncbi:MAG: leucine--tRNA ligase [Christensenellales bacterium]
MQAREIEKKWQKKWEETHLYRFNPRHIDKKWYVMEMFSYPSGAKLHVGHWYNYGPSDTYARFKRMQGYEVFQPMGFDAFGLPAENYAIKTGVHPKDSTLSNINTMEIQLKAMGAMFDWDYEVVTCDPGYYKWTQWCFLQLYKNGLAYRKEAPVNWCPSCNTVLANEQVIEGCCERCSSEVIRRNLTQWFFKITDYAEELLDKLDGLHWPERTKTMQRNWIGKSVGSEVMFAVDHSDTSFSVFTTRPDTLYGCTYVVLAPENPLVGRLTAPECRAAVENYIQDAAKASEIERLSTSREKTGVFIGAYAINPVNGRRVPIWVADYVLATYGTGAVMAVPAHDERDYIFAEKYNLPIERVVAGEHGSDDLPFVEYGVSVNSGRFSGMKTQEAKEKITESLKEKNLGDFKVNYRLRDWLISRQRYWGAPIPVVHCPCCGDVPVPEKDLPVLLPYDVDFRPDGTSPLAGHEGFMNTTCPICGGKAKRDADTMDTFVCSSWYFLRYYDNRNDKEAFSKEKIDSMLPVDKYIGGAEHACLHLLYARFFTKALRDLGYLSFDEPFTSLVHQGVILGPDGNKMSKSHGNVISPDEYIERYGADVFRMYLMFGFSYVEGGIWSDDGIKAIHRYLERIEKLAEKVKSVKAAPMNDKQLDYALHYAIKTASADIERFQFNTAIARLMELVNAMYKYAEQGNLHVLRAATETFLKLLAPFAPHFAEEMWELIGMPYSIFNQPWPDYNEAALRMDIIELAVQINGKVKSRIEVDANTDEEGLKKAALDDSKITAAMEGRQIAKVIVIKDRLINIVVK